MRFFLIAATTISLATYSFAFTPDISLNTQTGSDNPLIAKIWWPAHQNKAHYWFTDIDASYSLSQNDSQAEVGLDYRHLSKKHWAFGFYHYLAFNYSKFKQTFYTWNPGFELLTPRWQLNWNLYLPLSQKSQNSDSSSWADNVGIYDYLRFAGHDQYNQQVHENSTTGTGTDLILSYRSQHFLHLTASLGAYYFAMPEHPLGIVAKLATPIKHHLSFSLSATHDPLTNNSINFGITAHIGNDTDDSNAWINKPVQHNLPLNVGANSIPIRNSYQTDGTELLQKDNVWFFSTDGSAYNSSQGLANCTAENPCSGLSSANLQQIASDAASASFANDPSIYLKPGTYTPPVLLLYGNESLIGRTADYKQNATGNNRAILKTGSILIDGQIARNNTLANLRLINDGASLSAIDITDTQNTTINNVAIGPDSSATANENYFSDLNISNANSVTINNSNLQANNANTGISLAASNILVENTNQLTINNSTLSTSVSGDLNQGTSGIVINGDSDITINDSSLNQTATGNNTEAFNIYNTGAYNANVSINRSTLRATTSSTGSNQGVFNIVLASQSTLNINHSSIYSDASSVNGLGATNNIDLAGSTTATISDSSLFAAGHAALQTGSTNLTTDGSSSVTINNSTLETDMAGGPQVTESSGAVPLWALGTSTITVNNSTIIARSLNSDTAAAPVQAQGGTNQTATININNSRLYAYALYGNTTRSDSSVIVAANNSRVNIDNTYIEAQTNGAANHNLVIVDALGNSQITLSRSRIFANNGYTPTSGSLSTIAFGAINNAVIYNNGTSLDLNGNNIKVEQTFDNGQVIDQ